MTFLRTLLIAVVVVTASAFAPVQSTRADLMTLSSAKLPSPFDQVKTAKLAPAAAAIATAMTPLVAHADTVDESTLIGYGAALVACVVSLVVGFALGYGTLVKP